MAAATTPDEPTALSDLERDALVSVFAEAFPAMSAADQRLAKTLYRLLANSKRVAAASLAGVLERRTEEIERLLTQWPGVFRDEDCVVGFWGLTVKETPHRLQVDGVATYTWCAWDTLWIPALLDATVQVVSRCAQTREPVRLRVSPERVESVEPAAVLLSFLKPEVRKLREHATANFCHFVHFFRDRKAAERWIAGHPDTFLISLEAAFDLGRRVNAARYRDSSAARTVLESILTCPRCATQRAETMPTDACVFFWNCPGCGARLKPKPGDCCVFCSYGSVPCPPKQLERGCCA